MEDKKFRNVLITSRFDLVKTLNLNDILPYMIQHKIMTTDMEEEIMSYSTSSQRVGKFLDNLYRRAWITNEIPITRNVFIDSLYISNQFDIGNMISDKLGHPRKIQPIATVSSVQNHKEPIFEKLSTSISRMKPFEKINERHGSIFLTSTSIFTDKHPISKLGEHEIPFLFVVKAYDYTIDNVLMWQSAPSKSEFIKSYEIYQQEVSEIVNILKNLDRGGIHMRIATTDQRLLKLLSTNIRINTYFTINPDGCIHIVLTDINISLLSQFDINILSCLIHLICFFDHNFVIRKSDPPKPNCYLLFKVKNCLHRSAVIIPSDYKIIDEAMLLDESISVPTSFALGCPW